MHTLRVIRTLGAIDLRNVRRDPLLRWIVVLPLLIALPVRWVLPVAVRRISELIGVDLLEYYPLAMGYAMLLLAPILAGMVIGFLLLDQRDDRTLTALQVTPLPLNSYLTYRLLAPMLVSLGTTMIVLPAAGLVHVDVVLLATLALAAAPMAPLVAVALAAFAANKVQGFALVKMSGLFLIAPLGAYFAPPRWEWAFAVVPTYWPAKVLWTMDTGGAQAWVYLLGGLAYQALLLWLLLRRFQIVMHRSVA